MTKCFLFIHCSWYIPFYNQLYKRLEPYGNKYFIGVQKQKSAFISEDNKNISGFKFTGIEYWNDTSALVQEEETWYIYDIKNKAVLYEDFDTYQTLSDNENETLMLITRQGKAGIISSISGEIIAPTFNDIINVGSVENPVYFAEKYIPEAEFYVIIYYDSRGKILRKQVFNKEEYDNIYCGWPGQNHHCRGGQHGLAPGTGIG